MKFKFDNVGWARCKHRFCTDCRTKRGNNRGNRNERHRIRRLLKKGGAQ